MSRIPPILCLLAALLSGCCTPHLPSLALLNVHEFGAKGDGVADDLPAFVAALDKARETSGPVTVRVPDGVYRLGLDPDSKAAAHLVLSKLQDVTLAGDTLALLVCTSPYHHGLEVVESQNVTVRNLAIDYDPLPFTQGTVVAVSPEEKLIDMTIAPGYLAPTLPHIDAFTGKPNSQVGYLFDPQTGRKLNQFYDQYLRTQVQVLPNGIYRFKSDNEVSEEFVGKSFAVIGRRKANAVKIHKSTNCRLEGLAIYSAPACGFHVTDSAGIVIDHCAIQQKPDTDRLMSTNADGLHEKWCRTGTTLSNSSFTGMGDDSVNIGGSYTPVLERIDDFTVIVEAHGSLTKPQPELVTVDRETHAQISLGALRSIRPQPRIEGYDRAVLRLTFFNALPPMTTWRESGEKRKCNQILNLNACGRGAQILNNHFYNHRVRGVLMRAPNSVIAGNHFDTLAGPGIVVSNDGGFLTEGPSGNGTLIVDNLFTNIERSNIWINSSIGPKSDASTQGVVGVTIKGNRFLDYGGPNIYGRGEVGNVLWISCASNLIIADNIIGQPADPALAQAPVMLQSVGTIDWVHNTIDGRPLDLEEDSAPMPTAP